MQITMFQSAQGDCLLLTDTGDQTRILVDGGMPASYTTHVAPALAKLRLEKKNNIDLVYVSHIDRDHIGGVLRMLDDEVLWRVHDHQVKTLKNTAHKPPKSPRPPVISAIWHNSFKDQAKKNAGPIEKALAASAPVLSGASIQELREAGSRQAGLISSILDALKVSQRIGPKQLGIPLNAMTKAQAAPGVKNKLLLARTGQAPVTLGQFKITILGPTGAFMDNLRKDWDKFVENAENKKALADIRTKALQDEKNLGAAALGQLLDAMRLQAEALGDPKQVTPPNLASLTLLVEENGTSILLTADARWDQVIAGLEEVGRLKPGQNMKVDVVKVPHHGSTHNVGETDFLDRVVAKDYVFCGNGHSDNPEVDVIKAMVKHRMKAPGKFKFWFNSSGKALAGEKDKKLPKHMRKVEKLVKQLAKNSKGRMTFKFLETGSSLRVL